MGNPLLRIPSLSDILENSTVKSLLDKISHGEIVSTSLSVLDELRIRARIIASERTLPSVTELGELVVRRITQGDPTNIRVVVNATGEILPEALSPAPMADEAIREMVEVAGNHCAMGTAFSGWDVNRQEMAVEKMIQRITGAEAAIVTNNEAGALFLLLSALGNQKTADNPLTDKAFSSLDHNLKTRSEVAVARCHVYESPRRGYRFSQIVEAAGWSLRETGSVNRTLVSDYRAVMGENTALCFYAFPLYYAITGSAECSTWEEVIRVTHEMKIPFLAGLGGGTLLELETLTGSKCGITGSVADISAKKLISGGADMVLIRGDGLLNGPGCAILLGRASLIQACREHPLAACVLPDGRMMASLEATLKRYSNIPQMAAELPVVQLLDASIENLRHRAQRIKKRLEALDIISEVTVRETQNTPLGCIGKTGTWNTVQLIIRPASTSKDTASDTVSMAARLASGNPAVWGLVEDDCLVLDLRSVLPRYDHTLASVFENL